MSSSSSFSSSSSSSFSSSPPHCLDLLLLLLVLSSSSFFMSCPPPPLSPSCLVLLHILFLLLLLLLLLLLFLLLVLSSSFSFSSSFLSPPPPSCLLLLLLLLPLLLVFSSSPPPPPPPPPRCPCSPSIVSRQYLLESGSQLCACRHKPGGRVVGGQLSVIAPPDERRSFLLIVREACPCREPVKGLSVCRRPARLWVVKSGDLWTASGSFADLDKRVTKSVPMAGGDDLDAEFYFAGRDALFQLWVKSVSPVVVCFFVSSTYASFFCV